MYFIRFLVGVAFEVEVLLGVCGFVVDICDDFGHLHFYKDV